MGKNFFTGTDHELYTGTAAFRQQISAAPASFGLVAAQVTAYAALSAAYTTAYMLANDPETRTRGVVAAKNTAKTSLRAMAADLAKIIDGTPTVTDQQRIDLGLGVRKPRTVWPRPATAPEIDVVSTFGRSITIRLRDAASSTRRGKPPEVAGAAIFSHVGPTAPTTEDGWKFEGNTTKVVETIEFADSVPSGAIVWFTAVWFNRRAQTGPNAAPVNANLPGGAARVAA